MEFQIQATIKMDPKRVQFRLTHRVGQGATIQAVNSADATLDQGGYPMNWSEDLERVVVVRPDVARRAKNGLEMNDELDW